MRQFIIDLLGRDTPDAIIFEKKSSHYFGSSHIISKTFQISMFLFVILLNLFCIYICILYGAIKGTEWQMTWIFLCFVTIFFLIFIFITVILIYTITLGDPYYDKNTGESSWLAPRSSTKRDIDSFDKEIIIHLLILLLLYINNMNNSPTEVFSVLLYIFHFMKLLLYYYYQLLLVFTYILYTSH